MDGGRCIGAFCKSELEPCFSRCSFSVTLITLQPVSKGQEIAAGFASRGKSELHRARCRVTDLHTRGQGVCEDALTASAAENKPPFFGG